MNTDKHRYFLSPFAAPVSLCGLILLFAFGGLAQELPDKIRGYKVYKAEIKESDVTFKLDDPKPVDISISSITLEISGEVMTLKQSGTIDFLTFKDFQINGLPIEIEEYKESFELRKNQSTQLPKPIKISLGLAQATRGALKEGRESKEFWQVSGRIFIFGRFKKFGFSFKRVVPIDVNLQIKNPLKVSSQQSEVRSQKFA